MLGRSAAMRRPSFSPILAIFSPPLSAIAASSRVKYETSAHSRPLTSNSLTQPSDI